MKITEIKIKNLFGLSDYNLKITDNKLIIVAENGGGKTTILKIIYYFLSKQWSLLSKYSFDKIEITINNEVYTYENKEKEKITDYNLIEKTTQDYPIKLDLLKIFKEYEFDNLKAQPFLIEKIELEKSWRKGQLLEVIEKIEEKSELHKDFLNFEDIPLLYLPTYRRTENEFMKIFSNLNQFTRGYLIDNFDFIKEELDILHSELSGLNENFEKLSINETEAETEEKLEDIQSEIEDTQFEIEDIEREISEKEDILNNFFSELWYEFTRIRKSSNDIHINFAEFGMQDVENIISNFLLNLKKENDENCKNKLIKIILNFTKIVQKYLTNNKNINYDKEKNKIFVRLKSNEVTLKLEQLSSGEKQIISIFVYLYLTKYDYFVIFDEPELSISIFWQKMLLPDICNAGANGILAATHSPYIYKNDMFENVNSLDNFTQTI